MTHLELLRRCCDAGLAAVSVPQEYEAESVVPGAIVYVRNARRPDGSESGIGETFNPYDSEEFWCAYRAEYARLKATDPAGVAEAEEEERTQRADRVARLKS
jgi:hypothetical protein